MQLPGEGSSSSAEQDMLNTDCSRWSKNWLWFQQPVYPNRTELPTAQPCNSKKQKNTKAEQATEKIQQSQIARVSPWKHSHRCQECDHLMYEQHGSKPRPLATESQFWLGPTSRGHLVQHLLKAGLMRPGWPGCVQSSQITSRMEAPQPLSATCSTI